MAVYVNVFNASSQQLNVSVNNGPFFTIAATGSSFNWSPQMPASGGPGWSNFPTPGSFASGQNQITVAMPGGQPAQLSVNLSQSMQWNSLQFYLFSTFNQVTWVALNNGQITGSGSVGG